MRNAPETMPLRPIAEIGAARDRAEHRLRALVDRHLEFLGRLLRTLGALEADVDDLLQNAFSITASRLDAIEPGKERAFLAQTAIRLAANARRSRARTREVAMEELPEVEDRRPTPEELS